MTLRGKLHHVRILVFGSARERRITLHLLRMKRRGFDLSGESAESLGLPPERSFRYGNSGGPDLDVVLKTLSISRTDQVLDVGCGKAGAMLTLANYPFARVDGIEISPKLAEIAQSHVRRAGIENAWVQCCDATTFDGYDPYTVLYMYNPFPESVFQQFLERLQVSIARRPRKLTFIYCNPLCHDLLLKAGFRHVRQFDHGHLPISVYELSYENRSSNVSA